MNVRICENGVYRDATEAEIARMEAEKPEETEAPEEATEADYQAALRDMGVEV